MMRRITLSVLTSLPRCFPLASVTVTYRLTPPTQACQARLAVAQRSTFSLASVFHPIHQTTPLCLPTPTFAKPLASFLHNYSLLKAIRR